MKIVKVSVDWCDEWYNHPIFVVEFDEPVDHTRLKYERVPFNERSAVYYAVDGDYADFLVHIPDREYGYGGRTFELTLTDGSKVKVKGPWSGNAQSVSSIVGKDFVDVDVVDDGLRFSGAVLAEPLLAACAKAGIEVGNRPCWGWEPKRDGKFKGEK